MCTSGVLAVFIFSCCITGVNCLCRLGFLDYVTVDACNYLLFCLKLALICQGLRALSVVWFPYYTTARWLLLLEIWMGFGSCFYSINKLLLPWFPALIILKFPSLCCYRACPFLLLGSFSLCRLVWCQCSCVLVISCLTPVAGCLLRHDLGFSFCLLYSPALINFILSPFCSNICLCSLLPWLSVCFAFCVACTSLEF